MADSSLDDVYDDPDNILAEDDDAVNGAAELPDDETDDLSQSIFVPEKDTTDLDDRGPIDELEASDADNADDLDDTTDPALLDEDPTELDPDSYHLGDVNPADEKDNTED